MRRESCIVLAQQAVPDKSTELALEATLLTPSQVQGRIVTADALPTPRSCCADIPRFGGDYVLLAKANQPTDGGRICASFSRSLRLIAVTGGGHGRGTRHMDGWKSENGWPAPNASAWLEVAWPGVEQACCLQRTSDRQGRRHSQTIDGITNLSPRQASAARLLELVRRPWASENRLQWRRDVTLREDHSQVRKGNAPQVCAALNNLILALFDFLGVQNVPQQMRRLDAQPQRAVRLVLGSLLTHRLIR